MYSGGSGSINAIVADFGTSTTKVGYAGEDVPASIVDSFVGFQTIGEQTNHILPNDLPRHDDIPLKGFNHEGLVADWDVLEIIWEYSIKNNLFVDTKEHPCLLSERSFSPTAQRHKFCEIWFEKYDVPALFISKDAVLSCFAAGRTTGLVADVGAELATVTPVSDGWAEQKGIIKSLVAGNMVNKYLQHIIEKRGQKIPPQHMSSREKALATISSSSSNYDEHKMDTSELEANGDESEEDLLTYREYRLQKVVSDIKEGMGRVSDTPVDKSDPRFANMPRLPYELPDGTQVQLGSERFEAPELLLNTAPLTEAVGAGAPGAVRLRALGAAAARPGFSRRPLGALVAEAAGRCDRDQQAALLGGVVLSGGGACFEGLVERLRADVERRAAGAGAGAAGLAPGLKVKVVAAGTAERRHQAWLGGSILASLGAYHELWMSREEYREYGTNLIDKKCP